MGFWSRKKRVPDAPAKAVDEISIIVERYIADIGRKELYEDGFAFCGAAITAAFDSAGQQLQLDHERDLPSDVTLAEGEIIRWLWVDDFCIVEEFNIYVELRLTDGAGTVVRGLDWDLIARLRELFRDPADPDRNWHLGSIDEGYLLILCRPDQLGAVQSHPGFEGFATHDLTNAQVVRRFAD